MVFLSNASSSMYQIIIARSHFLLRFIYLNKLYEKNGFIQQKFNINLYI